MGRGGMHLTWGPQAHPDPDIPWQGAAWQAYWRRDVGLRERGDPLHPGPVELLASSCAYPQPALSRRPVSRPLVTPFLAFLGAGWVPCCFRAGQEGALKTGSLGHSQGEWMGWGAPRERGGEERVAPASSRSRCTVEAVQLEPDQPLVSAPTAPYTLG